MEERLSKWHINLQALLEQIRSKCFPAPRAACWMWLQRLDVLCILKTKCVQREFSVLWCVLNEDVGFQFTLLNLLWEERIVPSWRWVSASKCVLAISSLAPSVLPDGLLAPVKVTPGWHWRQLPSQGTFRYFISLKMPAEFQGEQKVGAGGAIWTYNKIHFYLEFLGKELYVGTSLGM